MRRSSDELREIGSYVVLTAVVLALVIVPPALMWALIQAGVLGYDDFDALFVLAVVLVPLLGWAGISIGLQVLATRREKGIDRVAAWALAHGYEEGRPDKYPYVPKSGPGHRKVITAAEQERRRRVDPTGISLLPFTLEGVLYLERALVRQVLEAELSISYLRLVSSFREDGTPVGGKRFTVVMASGLHDLPLAWIEPQGRRDRALLALGAKDVDVESAEFNAGWRVYATDVRAAHGFLSPRVIQHFIESDGGRDSLALSDDVVIAARSGWLAQPYGAARLDALVAGMVHALPAGYRVGGGPGASRESLTTPGTTTTVVARPSLLFRAVQAAIVCLAIAGAIGAPALDSITDPNAMLGHLVAMVVGLGLALASGRLARFILGDRRAVTRHVIVADAASEPNSPQA